jgi:hypothetical protein
LGIKRSGTLEILDMPANRQDYLTIEPSIVDKPIEDEEQNRIFISQLGDITD